MFLAACQNAPEAHQATATEAQRVENTTSNGTTYQVNLTESKLQWTGTKPVGQHVGTFNLKAGSLMVADNHVTGGKFVFDIPSLTPIEDDKEMGTKLKNHLLSPDFFDAEKHPEAAFEITSVKAGVAPANTTFMKDATHTIVGNLTLKGVTKSISFPAKINTANGTITADANFNIDRTQWGLNYGNDKSLGDKFINPQVNIVLHVAANA